MKKMLVRSLAAFFCLTASVLAVDWTQFRGPGGLATGDASGLPIEFSDDNNLVWKTELPGLGTSSPITLGDRIYVTCYSGYGVEPNQGDQQDLRRHVACLNRATGELIWSKEFEPELPESQYSGGNNARHGYSSSTPTTDGKHLYVFFGKSGVYCLDLDGNVVWRTLVGSGTRGWGSSNSPVLFNDLVIINASIESGSLIALNKATGEEAWKADATIRGSWNTPLLVEVAGGKTELVLCVPQRMLAFDPATGDALWNCEGIPDRGYVCPSVIAHDDVVYAIGGRQNTAIAVRAGGRGDVTDTHELWRTNKGSNVASPVYHDGYIFWAHESRGNAYCLDAKTGAVVYEERLNPRPGLMYASVTQVDGKLYYVSQHNGVYVVAAKPEFALLAHNQFQDDSRSNACPVVNNGQLLLRSDRYLYCVAQ